MYRNVGLLSLDRYSSLAEQFAQQFPGHDLPSMLAKFSLPVSLAEFRNPLEALAQEVGLSYNNKYKANIPTPSHSNKHQALQKQIVFNEYIF